MGIRELEPENFVAPYKRPRFGSAEAEAAWKDRQAKRKAKQTVLAVVAEGCSVETVRGTTLRDGEEVTPADAGGGVNPDRLASVGAVNKVTENEAKTNAGEFEFVAVRSFTYPGGIVGEGEGFDAEQLDRPGTEPSQAVTTQGKIVEHPGRPAVDGAAKAEELVKRGLAERARLRAKVTAAVKKRLKREAASESGA